MPYLYLARWEWVTEGDMSFWRAPRADICRGLLDLRSLPQCGTPVTPEGFGLFALTERDDSIGYYLGDDLQRTVSNQAKRRLAQVLGLGEAIVADTPLSILRELLVFHADPTGQLRWKPLRISRKAGLRLLLADADYREAFAETHPAFANTVEVFKADYRRNKADGMPLEALRKWTGSTMLKLWGRMGDDLVPMLLPPEYSTDGWDKPATAITDNLNRANADALGTSSEGWSWTEVQGDIDIANNEAKTGDYGTSFGARAEQALSSDEHYTQVVWTATAGGSKAGPSVRFAAAANSYYYGWTQNNASISHRIGKMVTGTRTALWDLGSDAMTAPQTLYLSQDSVNLLTYKVGGVTKVTGTDNTLTGNLHTGISCDGGWPATLDNFAAGDLAAAASPYYYSIWRRMQMQS